MRVLVVPARLGCARKAVCRSGDTVIVAYDPEAGGCVESAREVAARIEREWEQFWSKAHQATRRAHEAEPR